MSKPEFVTAYLALKRKADAGDPKAKSELAKLLKSPQFVAALKQLAAAKASAASNALALIQATDVAAEEAADDIIGAEEETRELHAGDDLEAADHVHSMLPPGSDDLDHKSALRKLKLSNLNQVAPFVRSNVPPSVMSGTNGGSQLVNVGETQSLINWAGDSDADIHPLTVTLAPVQQISENAFPGTAGMRPFATVRWGTKSYQSECFVDIGAGCQFTVIGSQITVTATLPEVAGVSAGQMRLSAQLGFQEVERNEAPVTFTLYADAVDSGHTIDMLIPPYAKTLQVWRDSIARPITVDIQTVEGITVQHVVLDTNGAASILYMFDPLWLPGDARVIELSGTSGTSSRVRAIFGLAI